MSLSPPFRRLSTASSSSKREEDLINAYEAEEEKIINILSRKLEKLREEKIELENTLEAESEAQVNRLNREISTLRLASQANGSWSGNDSPPDMRNIGRSGITEPSTDVVLEALKRENEQLRARLSDTERDYIRMTRMNEIYREELIDHRRRLGLPVDNLIGMANVDQPTHRRSQSSASSTSSLVHLLSQAQFPRALHGVPIPRPPSQIHRPTNQPSELNTPQSHSPSSTEPPSPLSLVMASANSVNTQMTTPPSSSYASHLETVRTLSYPMVPPPSLSSSFGSPTTFQLPRRDHSASPVGSFGRQNVHRRGSFERRLTDGRNGSQSRKESVERGARIAETGTLIRGRTSSIGGLGASSSPSGLVSAPAGLSGTGQ